MKLNKKYDGNVHMYLNSKAGERTYVHTCEKKNKMVELKDAQMRIRRARYMRLAPNVLCTN